MDHTIGTRILALRRQYHLTQEQLADLIGVSFQAVSKWENALAYPDITLIPKLAQLFHVTTDDLFGYDREKNEAEIQQYVTNSVALRETEPEKARALLEEGLTKYPESDLLLNHLLYVLDYRKNPDETIRTAEKLIERTDAPEIRCDALRFLAYAYHEKGDETIAASALEQIPELSFTKLSELAFVTSGKQKREAAEKQKWLSFGTLLQMMEKLAESYEEEGAAEQAVSETARALSLLRAMDAAPFDDYVRFFEKRLEKRRKAAEDQTSSTTKD